MTHSGEHDAPHGIGDLPIQPTGSGVADLEIAYEQMTLADGGAPQADDGTVPVEDSAAVAESAAHPS